MTSDITRQTFRPRDHRAGVVMQQGRVQLDADWNEQADITRYRAETTARAVIGETGAPKDEAGGGFAVELAPGGDDLLVSAGRLWVDGILCENTPDTVGGVGSSANQVVVSRFEVDGHPFAADQWVDVEVAGNVTLARVTSAVAASRTLALAPAIPGLANGVRARLRRRASLRNQPHSHRPVSFTAGEPGVITPGRHVVGLEVWLREISVVEDPTIGEPALNGLDTANRLQVVWQVVTNRLGPAGQGTCETAGSAFPPAPSTGRMIAQVVGPTEAPDPCLLPDHGGYRGLEHQLYRVEVHRVFGNNVVLKWQRDNATMVSRINGVGSTFRVDDTGKDSNLGFTQPGFVELVDDALELAGESGDLLRILSYAPHLGEIVTDPADAGPFFDTTPTRARNEHRPRARRWDGRIVATAGNAAFLTLERGLQVSLTAGTFRPGDHWLVPARTATTDLEGGTILWPRDDAGQWLPMAPDGIHRHYCRLALVDSDADGFLTGAGNLLDCRPTFPALTAIHATDVAVDPTVCEFVGVETVQDAIDRLCQRSAGGTCTETAIPGEGWEQALTGLDPKSDAEVCLPVGTYPLAATLVVTGSGHLVLHGAGWGSVIQAPGADAALVFRGFASVTVKDLQVRAGVGGARPRPNPAPGLRGALAFEQCRDVVVDGVRVRCAPRTQRRASCIAIYGAGGTDSGVNTARVAHCHLEVGENQVGVLGVNLGRYVVEDNVLRVAALVRKVNTMADLSKAERRTAGTLLARNMRPAAAGGDIDLSVGQKRFTFDTIPQAKTMWTTSLRGKSFSSTRSLASEVDKTIRAVVAGKEVPGSAALATFLLNRVALRRNATMAQGVVAGGSALGYVRVAGNDVDAALQGVHVATSHQTERAASADRAKRVMVTDNRIGVVVPAQGARARHGIFVGNAVSVTIQDNQLAFTTFADNDPIDSTGIKVFGFVDRMLVVRENHLSGFDVGIHVFPLLPKGGGQLSAARLYRVSENLMVQPGATIVVQGPLSRK